MCVPQVRHVGVSDGRESHINTKTVCLTASLPNWLHLSAPNQLADFPPNQPIVVARLHKCTLCGGFKSCRQTGKLQMGWWWSWDCRRHTSVNQMRNKTERQGRGTPDIMARSMAKLQYYYKMLNCWNYSTRLIALLAYAYWARRTTRGLREREREYM